MQEFDNFIQIVKRKYNYDKMNPWKNGIESYLSGIEDEVHEVRQEIKNHDLDKLETELGDILWDYINLLQINIKKLH